jgi:hypothetical protein
MTFDEIVTEVASHLNVTSTTSSTRIGRLVNRYYKRVTTAIGIPDGTRISVSASANTTIGSRVIQFTSVEKVTRVFYLSGTTRIFLTEVSLDELLDIPLPATSDTPTKWASYLYTDNDVSIMVNTLASTQYAMKADCYAVVSTLSGSNVPQFPESFHDVLVYGVLKEEFKKMGHKDEAADADGEYRERLSDLRMWFAKSKYKQIQQHKYPAANHVDRDGTQGDWL